MDHLSYQQVAFFLILMSLLFLFSGITQLIGSENIPIKAYQNVIGFLEKLDTVENLGYYFIIGGVILGIIMCALSGEF